MSQEDIRKLLSELGGEANIDELSKTAKEQFPDRTLHKYLTQRLKSMEKKGIVVGTNNGKSSWRLSREGAESSITYPLGEIDAVVNRSELTEKGFSLANLVGSVSVGKEFDLSDLSKELENADYHPETYPNIIYRPLNDKSLSILIPSSGRLTIVGGKSKQDLITGMKEFNRNIDISIINNADLNESILIQNVVANYDFEQEFDLSVVALSLDLNSVEYDPDQFPGLIYRPKSGNATILLFRSGKLVITGARTYIGVIQARNELTNQLEDIGVGFEKEMHNH